MTDGTVQVWIDKCELGELVARLSAAVDRGDEHAIVACYTHDSHDDHGLFKGSGRDFAAMICAPASPGASFVMHHQLGQSVFEVDGENAWGETFFIMHAVRGDDTAVGLGRYIDHFRRTDTGWKVAYRRVVPDSTIPGDDLGRYWRSTRDSSDPRYDRLTGPPTP